MKGRESGLKVHSEIGNARLESGKNRGLQSVGVLQYANPGRRVNLNFTISVIQKPHFHAASAQIFPHFAAHFHYTFRGRQHFDCNIGGKGGRDFIQINEPQAISEENGKIRTANFVFGDSAIIFANHISDWISLQVDPQEMAKKIPNFVMPERATR